MSALQLERDVLHSLESALDREWLVTNGLGGYASGTIAGCNTRRYHGLLVAALRPPVERTVMVAKLDATVRYREVFAALTTNEYDGTVDPKGYLQLESFHLDGQIPVWTWRVQDALIEQRVWMEHGKNTTYVTYTVLRSSDVIDFELLPLCTYRDYHSHTRGERNFFVSEVEGGIKIDAHWGAHAYRILVENAQIEMAGAWYWNFKHRAESERGLDDSEDLFRPAVIRSRLNVGDTFVVILTAESTATTRAKDALAIEIKREAELLSRANVGPRRASRALRPELERLVLAADQFIVERRDAAGKELGKTVIAGYPWFSDWGRDTMIALPGLTLTTQRHDEAASILRTFANFVNEGMLPNRFPDAGETPEYNTVDATLWYFIAVDEYFRATGDMHLVKELYPTLREIIDWHVRGTRFSIHVDSDDGLLFAGEAGVQLTWMDAKIGDWVVTPRIGKPVEINALWFNALTIAKDVAQLLRDRDAVRRYATMAGRVAENFKEKFWAPSSGHLYDVIHGPEGQVGADDRRYDASLRPNQLLAISLRHVLLDGSMARAVVDTCARELWTPVGMRSLSPRDPRYVGRYVGGPRERDAVYHQGTAWSWLLGPFAIAHYKVYRDEKVALSFLNGGLAHLREGCIGQISEIFDGDAPFMPRGCCAQAWGVSEILRAWSAIHEEHRAIGQSIEGEHHARKTG